MKSENTANLPAFVTFINPAVHMEVLRRHNSLSRCLLLFCWLEALQEVSDTPAATVFCLRFPIQIQEDTEGLCTSVQDWPAVPVLAEPEGWAAQVGTEWNKNPLLAHQNSFIWRSVRFPSQAWGAGDTAWVVLTADGGGGGG